MAKLDKLISKGESAMLSAEENFASDIRGIEEKLLREIYKILDTLDVKSGKLQTSEETIKFLNKIESVIDEALKKSGYNSRVKDYLKNFDTIRRNNIEIHSLVNGANISYASLNDVTRLEIENTIEKLVKSGVSKDFKIPIKEALYRNVVLGSTIQETKKTIDDFILSNSDRDSKLLRYTTQVSRDAINQYDGAIQTVIKNELGLTDFIYSGSIIKDSRCQCRYWVNKIKLPADELAEEIETALNRGTLGGCVCSGMIPGTNLANFAINRGGYSCRHRAIATSF